MAVVDNCPHKTFEIGFGWI